MTMIPWRPAREIERWEPLREFQGLRREMERLWDRFSRFDQILPFEDRGFTELSTWPTVELDETEDAVQLRVEIPGLEAKDLDIQVAEDSVSIRGERRSERRAEEFGMMRSEFYYGRFERIIPLPVAVKSDQARAEYKNGILEINLPKTEEQRRKAIKVPIS
ncbi:Hsp20/alpha crystallin family protein [Anthocerotibacter panamensis]|uniref:Hsp20/alpha crystallin family protein n=1 Tax=Anthocerotibacter panamensis TaxID=2857077 RepID=UPI001C40618A|nr:Hsp20/alpha crystallin family protein [Anthocerotibacter panamensis]